MARSEAAYNFRRGTNGWRAAELALQAHDREEFHGMRPLLFALSALAFLGTLGSAVPPAKAQEYPWCAQYSERMGGGRNCGFVSLRQCQATISGAGGWCEPNPRYTEGRGHQRRSRAYGPYERD